MHLYQLVKQLRKCSLPQHLLEVYMHQGGLQLVKDVR